MGPPISDEDLMLRYRDGDAAAFDQLYARHKGGVYRYLLRSVKTKPLADELFQEVWLSLVRARTSYAVSAKFTTFLYRVAHSRLIDHHRSQSVVKGVFTEVDEEAELESLHPNRDGTPEQIIAAKQQAHHVVGVLEAMPLAQREAYLLFEEGDMTVDEIAGVTGVNRETAKSRLRYAFNRLRQALAD